MLQPKRIVLVLINLWYLKSAGVPNLVRSPSGLPFTHIHATVGSEHINPIPVLLPTTQEHVIRTPKHHKGASRDSNYNSIYNLTLTRKAVILCEKFLRCATEAGSTYFLKSSSDVDHVKHRKNR
jgi:hypothetical protein